MAAGFGTLLAIPTFWLVVAAIVAADPEGDLSANPGVLAGIAIAIVPLTMVVVAWVSRRDRMWVAAALGTATAVLIATALSFAWWEPVSPMVAGFGAGGVLTLSRHPAATTTARVLAVSIGTVYAGVMVAVAPQLSIGLGPVIPFVAVAGADAYMARRADR